MQHQHHQQQQLAQSRSESWAAVHANLQNPAASSQLGNIEYGKPGPLTRLSIESVNDERRRYQQNYDQFVSQQQISQMTLNQELSALHLSQLHLSQRQRELEQQQQLLLLQQQDQEQQQQQQQQQMTLAKNAAIMQQIQQLQQQQLQLQQMRQMQTQQEQMSPRDGKKKSSYDDLGMIEDEP
jgi:hypothetical protein